MDLFFLDSAVPSQVELAANSGMVSGVTTNPAILHSADPNRDPTAQLSTLLGLFPHGPVFHQLHAAKCEVAKKQVTEILATVGDSAGRLVFKLPAQPAWFAFGADLVRQGYVVAFTAVYQPGQLLAAAQAGARYVIPYVDRAARLRPDAPDVVAHLSAIAPERSPLILAASIKSASQGVAAFRSGAHAITAAWEVLEEMMTDELTDSAVEQFCAVVPW